MPIPPTTETRFFEAFYFTLSLPHYLFEAPCLGYTPPHFTNTEGAEDLVRAETGTWGHGHVLTPTLIENNGERLHEGIEESNWRQGESPVSNLASQFRLYMS